MGHSFIHRGSVNRWETNEKNKDVRMGHPLLVAVEIQKIKGPHLAMRAFCH
jgi:hypothetical protein